MRVKHHKFWNVLDFEALVVSKRPLVSGSNQVMTPEGLRVGHVYHIKNITPGGIDLKCVCLDVPRADRKNCLWIEVFDLELDMRRYSSLIDMGVQSHPHNNMWHRHYVTLATGETVSKEDLAYIHRNYSKSCMNPLT